MIQWLRDTSIQMLYQGGKWAQERNLPVCTIANILKQPHTNSKQYMRPWAQTPQQNDKTLGRLEPVIIYVCIICQYHRVHLIDEPYASTKPVLR